MRIVVLLGVAWVALALAVGPSVDIAPEMAEVDGVHPLRALQALEQAYELGGGFADKYPPLGSFVMGLAVRVAAPSLVEADPALRDPAIDEVARRRALSPLAAPIRRALAAQRWCSRIAMAVAVVLVGVLAGRAAASVGVGAAASTIAAALAAIVFGAGYPTLYYGSTTNVDAFALAASLLALERAAAGRWLAAGAAFGLAVAFKEPSYAVGVALLAGLAAAQPALAGAHWHAHDGHAHVVDAPEGRGIWLLRLGAATAVVYGLLSGAFTGPSAWLEHVRYLLGPGVDTVAASIDHTDPLAWAQLVDAVRRALWGVAAVAPGSAWLGVVVLVGGLVGLATLPKASRGLLLGAFVAPIVAFVLPVGFLYVRFLLVPWAMLAIGLGVALARLAVWPAPGGAARSAAPAGRARLAVVAAGAALVGGAMLASTPALFGSERPREALAGVLAARLEPGATVHVFADERRHTAPLDPDRWTLRVEGLAALETRAVAWGAGRQPLPDAVVVSSFPLEVPDGRPFERPVPPDVGAEILGGLFEVAAVLGAPTGDVVERTIAIRPTLTVLVPVAERR